MWSHSGVTLGRGPVCASLCVTTDELKSRAVDFLQNSSVTRLNVFIYLLKAHEAHVPFDTSHFLLIEQFISPNLPLRFKCDVKTGEAEAVFRLETRWMKGDGLTMSLAESLQ